MDGTENLKGTSGKSQDSSKGEQGTSEQTPETFTKAQVDKIKSDALAEVGRTAKALEEREKAIKSQTDEIAQWKKEQEAAQEEAARDDPVALKQLRQKQKLDAQEADFNKLKADHEKWWGERQAEVEEVKTTKFEIAVFNIAQKNGADASTLKDAAVEFNLTTEEQIESLAKRLAKGEPTKSMKLDSGKTTGGGKDLSSLSGRELIEKGLEKKK